MLYCFKLSVGHGSDNFSSFFFLKKESMGANDPQDKANSEPRGMVGKIYVGDHLTLLYL